MLKRALSYILLFAAGIGAGAILMHLRDNTPQDLAVSREKAIAILGAPPVKVDPSADSPFIPAVRRIEPAVVNIDTVGKLAMRDAAGMPFLLNEEVRGKGSGVVLTPDGYIVTNNHVIEGATRIKVTLASGAWYYASLVGSDPQTDLAVLHVAAKSLPAAQFGDSHNLEVGDWAIAVGNPLGLGSTVTVGVVSALNRHNLRLGDGRGLTDAIQTDAPINRGNSGGALANIAGQLIGINTAILSSGPQGGSIGLGFAIPSNTVKRIALEIIKTGHLPGTPGAAWLGVEFSAVPENLAVALALSPNEGAAVVRVLRESPASMADIQPGDVLIALDGHTIKGINGVADVIHKHKVGDHIAVTIARAGQPGLITRDVVLAARPEAIVAPP